MITEDKFLFNTQQLEKAFKISRLTISKMLASIEPVGKSGRSKLFDINDVADLKDTRDPTNIEKYKNKKYKTEDPTKDKETTNPDEMTAIQRINYYKAEDLRQSAKLKKLKNNTEEGKLMVATEVERTIADAFKKIALVLDTLPDLLERDGIIGSCDIERVITVLDNSQQQLAIDLSEISPMTKEINEQEDW